MFSRLKSKNIIRICFLFLAAFFVGTGAAFLHDHFFPAAVPTSSEGNWGLSFQTDGDPPVGNATFDELKKFDAFYAQDTGEKVIYLTFDAGYENGNTPAILEALTKHQAPATFFVVGTLLESNPELIKQILAAGNTIGNHTWHHKDMSQISTMESFSEEIQTVEKLYRQITWTGNFQILSSTTRQIQRSQPENGTGSWLSYLLLESRLRRLVSG